MFTTTHCPLPEGFEKGLITCFKADKNKAGQEFEKAREISEKIAPRSDRKDAARTRSRPDPWELGQKARKPIAEGKRAGELLPESQVP